MSPAPPVGPGEFRARFPALARTVHLAACSLGARSVDLDKAMTGMLDAMAEHGVPWDLFEEQVAEAKRRFATLIGAEPEQIALVPNASVGAYQAASTMDWSARPEIVTTDVEFPTLSHVWLAQTPRGARVRHVAEHAGTVTAPDYHAAITERTGLVSVPLATYRAAARLPVAEIAAHAHAAGARVFVDAYQAAGVEPVSVTDLGCDYLVAGTLKYLLGLPGVAFLYVRSGVGTGIDPQLTGWFGRVEPFAFDPHRLDFPATARRFETGTPSVPACYAANAGLGLVGLTDQAAVRRHVTELGSDTITRLTEQGERVCLPGDPRRRGAHVAMYAEQPARVADWLAERHIAVAPRGDVVRISFHYYNNADDVDAVCTEIGNFRKANR